MSIELLTLAKKQTLKPTLKLCLMALADSSNDDGECWPSYNTIGQWCCVKRDRAIDLIKELHELGYIARKTPRQRENKSHTTNIYQLSIPPLVVSKTSPPPSGADTTTYGCGHHYPSGADTTTLVVRTPPLIEEPLIESSIEPKENNAPAKADAITLQSLGVEKQIEDDWLEVRKAKHAGKVTPTVIAALQREASKAGITPNEAVRFAAESGWQAFKASWYLNQSNDSPSANKPQKKTMEDWAREKAAERGFNVQPKG